MTRETFHHQLLTYLRRKPFQAFTMLLRDGRRFDIDRPGVVATDGGAAGYFDPIGELHFIECEEVQEILATPQETAS